MTKKSKYLFIASMDVESEQEDLFNEVYDKEHVPNLLTVPGRSVRGALQDAGTDHAHRRGTQGDAVRRRASISRSLRGGESGGASF